MSIHDETFNIPQSTQADIKNTGWEIVENNNEDVDGLSYETTNPGVPVIPEQGSTDEETLARIKAAKRVGGFIFKRYKALHMKAA